MRYVISKTSRKVIIPGIDIYSYGRCSIRKFDGTEIERQVPPVMVSELLRFLDQSGFFEVTAMEIDSKVQVARHSPDGSLVLHFVSDDIYTAVSARTASKTNRIERYALDHELEWYPEIMELKLLRDAIHRVCEVVGEKGLWRR
jgi:hypothetical protein